MTLGTTEFLLSLHKSSGISPLSFKIWVCASPFSFLAFDQLSLGGGFSPAYYKFSPGALGFHVKLGHGPALAAFLQQVVRGQLLISWFSAGLMMLCWVPPGCHARCWALCGGKVRASGIGITLTQTWVNSASKSVANLEKTYQVCSPRHKNKQYYQDLWSHILIEVLLFVCVPSICEDYRFCYF